MEWRLLTDCGVVAAPRAAPGAQQPLEGEEGWVQCPLSVCR